MDKRKRMLADMKRWCRTSNINFADVSRDLLDFIGSGAVIDYCITQGPMPDFPNTIGDCYVLGERCLYDYEITQNGALRHFLPLNMIQSIAESFEQIGNEDFLQVFFIFGITGMVMCDRLDSKERLRAFSNAVQNSLILH